MIINDIIWKQQFVEKISFKHQVSIIEVEEVLNSHPFVCKVARGQVDDEDIYAAYSQIHNGRYLIVFFIKKKGNRALPISARDMDRKERKYYENQKKSKKRY
ncbi:MAG: BrnT family toxin [Candidatus Aminicenantes bacterium]|nr:BrnT family toxin [Candidatus Aminicenantes bacterium]NIM81500.1 BrnT family toxin [Candidatus Aminicenantes bacterium]NIN20870.1 BrnT family toxin [Candidatus Aminicenantes bacterium]NIN44691.1 BrnT family toxin [Candidatus Aminicenantes bacterium]NIN87499.1 BrnT family toxin [Candidatus Aminicenantes bacterium]